MMGEIKSILRKIKKFRDDRNWLKYHDPKNLAISIIIEASELLEHFQWRTKKEIDTYIVSHKQEIKHEIADVAIYLFELADQLEINLISAIEEKIKINNKKYPVSKSKNSHAKHTNL